MRAQAGHEVLAVERSLGVPPRIIAAPVKTRTGPAGPVLSSGGARPKTAAPSSSTSAAVIRGNASFAHRLEARAGAAGLRAFSVGVGAIVGSPFSS